mgnify:CR=1 FL=1
MRSIQSIIFSNSLAIVLTIVCLLPITAVFIFSLSAPIDDAFASFGLWLHWRKHALSHRTWGLEAVKLATLGL